MKKSLILLLFLAAAAGAAWFFLARPRSMSPHAGASGSATLAPPQRGGASLGARPSLVRPKTGADARPAPASRRASPEAPAQGGIERPPEKPSAPIKVRFESKAIPKKGQPVPVTVIVESVPKSWPIDIGENARLNLMLRLPVGIQMRSADWTPVPLPKEDENDPSGPWSLYEKEIPIQVTPGVPPEFLAKETVQVAVTEEGTNWVMTTRARLTYKGSAWLAFGAFFATLKNGRGEFHAIPKGPEESPRA